MEAWKRKFRNDLAFHLAKLKVTLGDAFETSDMLQNRKDKKTRPLDGFRFEVLMVVEILVYTYLIITG